jgi:nucleotide sugar dehydrogenase
MINKTHTSEEQEIFRIGIVGNGFVGSSIASGFSLHSDVKIFDVNPQRSTHSLHDTVNNSDVIFLSVPTPMRLSSGEIDLGIMDTIIEKISVINKRKDNVLVIKSTVVPGTIEKYIDKHSNLNIVFSPEFLTERAARLDFINSSRVVLGGAQRNVDLVEKAFRVRFPYVRIIKTDVTTAQFIKYMANCFFSTKISFMNEMLQAAEAMNVDWSAAMEGFVSDGRIGNSHLEVPGHDGSRGFGGKCFPKDLNAFICRVEEAGVSPTVLKAVWDKNMEVREDHDWLDIEGATS